MSEQNNSILSVRDLVLHVMGDGAPQKEIRYGSFDIHPGDFLLIKGHNGCGKSTLLRMFRLQGTTYFKVAAGEILFHRAGFPEGSIHTYSADELSQLSCAVAFIDQDERFLSSDSAYSYMINVCRIALDGDRSLTPADRRERMRAAEDMIAAYYEKYLHRSFDGIGYKAFKKRKVRAFSGGQQKMIHVLAGIIKARAAGLSLLIMDEPLNNLDGRNKCILNALIADLRAEGIAIMAITHCQIFGNVQKTLTLEEGEDSICRATLSLATADPHRECLEEYL